MRLLPVPVSHFDLEAELFPEIHHFRTFVEVEQAEGFAYFAFLLGWEGAYSHSCCALFQFEGDDFFGLFMENVAIGELFVIFLGLDEKSPLELAVDVALFLVEFGTFDQHIRKLYGFILLLGKYLLVDYNRLGIVHFLVLGFGFQLVRNGIFMGIILRL